MKKLFSLIFMAIIAVCGLSWVRAEKLPAPTDLKAINHDGYVEMTWNWSANPQAKAPGDTTYTVGKYFEWRLILADGSLMPYNEFILKQYRDITDRSISFYEDEWQGVNLEGTLKFGLRVISGKEITVRNYDEEGDFSGVSQYTQADEDDSDFSDWVEVSFTMAGGEQQGLQAPDGLSWERTVGDQDGHQLVNFLWTQPALDVACQVEIKKDGNFVGYYVYGDRQCASWDLEVNRVRPGTYTWRIRTIVTDWVTISDSSEWVNGPTDVVMTEDFGQEMELRPPTDLYAEVRSEVAAGNEPFVTFTWVGEEEIFYEICIMKNDREIKTLTWQSFGEAMWTYGENAGTFTWKMRAVLYDNNENVIGSSDWVTAPEPFVIEGEGIQVAEPVFSLADGEEVEPGTEVTLSCATEGAKIYYIINEHATPNIEYTEAIKLTADTTVIYAWAMIAGEDTSDVVKAVYYVKNGGPEPPVTAVRADLAATVKIYPNPAAGTFNVSLPFRAQVDIIAANGALVQSRQAGEGVTAFNVPLPGLYFVRIKTATEVVVRRIIVK